MAAKKTFYITTAIDYVNARPHVGHAFEKTLADAIARFHRLRGNDVFFLTGVDENAQKNVQAAEKAGVPVREFVDKNTGFFLELCKKLNISYDDFIRTSAKEHALVVKKILEKLKKKGDIYKAEYEGLYCVGCEAYYTEKDLVNGKCPEHNREPEHRKEEAYFFKLSKYQKELLDIIPKYVVPEKRAKEVLVRVKEGLNDLCISRKGAEWGIDFPGDDDFKVYVWVDALINYISGLKGKEKKYWPADVHVIGKGINWFHSVIWPALLLAADYKLPEKLLVHGYLTAGEQKISKSLGNVVDPLNLLEKYSADAVRYSLLRCSVFEDSDYNEDILIERCNNELADKLGNLISRVSTLAEKYGLEETKPIDSSKTIESVERHFKNFELDRAVSEIFAFIDQCDKLIQDNKPWVTRNTKFLYQIANAIKDISILLYPLLPETSEKIAKTFNFEISIKELNKPLTIKPIKKAEILFKKIEIAAPANPPKPQNEPQTKQKSDNNLKSKKPKIEGVANMADLVKYEDFAKLDLRVGTIKKVEDIEGADKLYKLEVEVGKEKRTIVAGIKQHYKKEELKDRQIVVICNLEPRKMKGIESKGMLLAAVNEDHSKVILLSPEKKIDSGSKVS